VYVDTLTVAAVAKPSNLADGRCVAIQPLQVPEVVNEGDIMVSIRQWFPAEPSVGTAHEVCFSKTTTVKDLFDVAERLSGGVIPRDSLRIGACDVSALCHRHCRCRIHCKSIVAASRSHL
jgi:hypothetical protein